MTIATAASKDYSKCSVAHLSHHAFLIVLRTTTNPLFANSQCKLLTFSSLGSGNLFFPESYPNQTIHGLIFPIQSTSERIPLVNRQLIHIVFLFHLITSPKRHNWSNKQVPVINRNRIQGIMACQAACITSSRSLSMRPLLSISTLHFEILQNLAVQSVHQFLW